MNYIIPSWRDLDVEISNSVTTYLEYQLTGRDLNYTGRAYPNPDGRIIVRVSDIIRDTLSPQMPISLEDGITIENEAYNTVVLSVNQTPIHTITMFLDNSFERESIFDETALLLSEPVTGVLDPRQRLIFNVGYYDGFPMVTVNGQQYAYDETYSYNVMFNTEMPTGNTVNINVDGTNTSYTIQPSSADYCLYYVNEKGGYDSILLNHKVTKKTVNTPVNYKKYGNNTTTNHQKMKLVNDSVITMEFVTGWLKDNQTERIHNIFNTTSAFLHDLNTDKIIPVNISTNQYSQMTMRSNGKKFVNFTIGCEYSINRKMI